MDIFRLPDTPVSLDSAIDSHTVNTDRMGRIMEMAANAMVDNAMDNRKRFTRIEKKVLTPYLKQHKQSQTRMNKVLTGVYNALQTRLSDMRLKYGEMTGKQLTAQALIGQGKPEQIGQVYGGGSVPSLPSPTLTLPASGGREPPLGRRIRPDTGSHPAICPPGDTTCASGGGGGGGGSGSTQCCCNYGSVPYIVPCNAEVTISWHNQAGEHHWIQPESFTAVWGQTSLNGNTFAGWTKEVNTWCTGIGNQWGPFPCTGLFYINCAVPGKVTSMIAGIGNYSMSGGPTTATAITSADGGTTYTGTLTPDIRLTEQLAYSGPATVTVKFSDVANTVKPAPPGSCGAGGQDTLPPGCCPPPVINVDVQPPTDPCNSTCPADFPAPDKEVDDVCMVISAPGIEGTLVIPAIGSPQFCSKMDDLVAFFGNVGNAIVDYLDKLFEVPSLQGEYTVSGYDSLNNAGPIAVWFAKSFYYILQGLVQQSNKYMKRLVCTWREMAAAIPCNAGTMLGLVVLRGVVASLREITVGISIPVRLTVVIPFDLLAVDRVLSYLIEYTCPSKIPSTGDANLMYSQGQINSETYECWVKMNGDDRLTQLAIRYAQSPHVSIEQLIEHQRRNGFDDATIDELAIERGYRRDDDREWMRELYDKLPPPSSVNSAWHRGTWNQEYAGRLQLDDGFDQFWTMHGPPVIHPQGQTQTYARWEYVSTRPVPSATSTLDYLYRLYPGSPLTGSPFSDNDYMLMLLGQGVAPTAAQWAFDTRYQDIREADAVFGFSLRVYNDDTITHLIHSQGQDPSREDELLSLAKVRRARDWARQGILPNPQTVIAGVNYKLWDIPTGFQMLTGQGYDLDAFTSMIADGATNMQVQLAQQGARRARMQVTRSIIQGYKVGTVSKDSASQALVNLGWNDDSANAFLTGIDAAEQATLASGIIQAIRAAYMIGRIPKDKLRQFLQGAGITQQRTSQYIATWNAERIYQKPDASLGDIKRWVKEGILSLHEASDMLTNLGYVDPAFTLNLDEMEYQLSLQADKLRKAQLKSLSQAAKVAIKASAVAKKAKQTAEATLRRQLPLTLLKKGLACGLFSEDEVRAKLTEQGYPENIQDDYITLWRAGKGSCQPNTNGQIKATVG